MDGVLASTSLLYFDLAEDNIECWSVLNMTGGHVQAWLDMGSHRQTRVVMGGHGWTWQELV